MLSKKMAFSLMSLITIFALAFTFVADDAFAAEKPFEIKIAGRTAATYAALTGDDAMVTVDLIVESAQRIPELTATAITGPPEVAINVVVTAFDRNGVLVPSPTITVVDLPKVSDPNVADGDFYAMRTAIKRKLRIAITQTADATDSTKGAIASVVVEISGGLLTTDPTVLATDGTDTKMNLSKVVHHTITISAAPAANADRPNVVSIQRLRPGSQTVVSAFEEAEVTGAFDVRIVFTELPRKAVDGEAFALDDIEVDGGTASNLVVGVPFSRLGDPLVNEQGVALTDTALDDALESTLRPHPIEGMYQHGDDGILAGVPDGADTMTVPIPTGDDEMYHQYRVTITPHRRVDMVKINIKEFRDNASPFPNVYKPFDVANKPNGREQLRLDVATDLAALGAGFMFYLPHANDAFITYAGTAGHYILTKDKAGSGIDYSKEKDDPDETRVENVAHKQTPAQLLYNVRASGDLPNLETFLANNGTIDLVSYGAHAAGSAYISEVMWGTDASQDDATKSQWIEIANGTSAAIAIGEKAWALWFYQANETPRATYVKDDGTAGVLIDRIGTKTFAGTVIAPATTGTTADIYWSIAG